MRSTIIGSAFFYYSKLGLHQPEEQKKPEKMNSPAF